MKEDTCPPRSLGRGGSPALRGHTGSTSGGQATRRPGGPGLETDWPPWGGVGQAGSAGSGRAGQSSRQAVGRGLSLVVWCLAPGDQGRGTCEGPRGGVGLWAPRVGLHMKDVLALSTLVILSRNWLTPGGQPGSARTRPPGMRTQRTKDMLSTRAQGTSRPTLGHQGRAHQVVACGARSHMSPMPPPSVLSRHLPFHQGAFSLLPGGRVDGSHMEPSSPGVRRASCYRSVRPQGDTTVPRLYRGSPAQSPGTA